MSAPHIRGGLAALSLLLATGVPAPARIGPGYFASPGTELVRHVPLAYDAAGGRVVGSHFYMTTSRDLRIYDISTPEDPRLVGSLPLLQEPQFSEEDLDTNGRIALVESFGTLYVIDVTDAAHPETIGTLNGPDYHTVSCILDCRYAYGSNGLIVDLREPTKPIVVGKWTTGTTVEEAHDVTEVAPGMVVTSSQPILFFDAQRDPTKPRLLATGANSDKRFIHANRWPRDGRDRFLLVGGETVGPRCDDHAGAFMVWDATQWKATKTFKMIDEYRVSAGLPTQGKYPYGQFCAHWFQQHPTFLNGGLVAMAWYDSGVRFLHVSGAGRIEEIGYFIAAESVASAAYWATDRIVYVVDYNRGFDVVRYGGPIERPAAAAVRRPAPSTRSDGEPRVRGTKAVRPLPATGVGSTGVWGLSALIVSFACGWTIRRGRTGSRFPSSIGRGTSGRD